MSKPANSFTAASTAFPSFIASSLLGAYRMPHVHFKSVATCNVLILYIIAQTEGKKTIYLDVKRKYRIM